MNITELISNEFVLPSVIVLIVLFFIIQLMIINKLKKKINAIPQVEASTLFEGKITDLKKELASLEQKNSSLSEALESILPKVASIKKTSLVRYNPFRDAGVGGLQSFSTALMDENGDGLVVSNLYSRTMTRVTAKEIKAWKPVDQELSPEEKQAIEDTK